MLAMLNAKADATGRFIAEWGCRAWAEWDFGQKREPSGWITLVARRTLQRVL
jgi:hypothetical protein